MAERLIALQSFRCLAFEYRELSLRCLWDPSKQITNSAILKRFHKYFNKQQNTQMSFTSWKLDRNLGDTQRGRTKKKNSFFVLFFLLPIWFQHSDCVRVYVCVSMLQRFSINDWLNNEKSGKTLKHSGEICKIIHLAIFNIGFYSSLFSLSLYCPLALSGSWTTMDLLWISQNNLSCSMPISILVKSKWKYFVNWCVSCLSELGYAMRGICTHGLSTTTAATAAATESTIPTETETATASDHGLYTSWLNSLPLPRFPSTIIAPACCPSKTSIIICVH